MDMDIVVEGSLNLMRDIVEILTSGLWRVGVGINWLM